MKSNVFNRSMYRSLLRVSRKMDAKPVSKALIYKSTLEEEGLDNAGQYYSKLLKEVMDEGYYMHPAKCATSLEAMVRREFRSTAEDPDDALDVALFCLKKTSTLLSLYTRLTFVTDTTSSSEVSPSTDKHEGQEALNKPAEVAGIAVQDNLPSIGVLHETKDLQPGMLLISHPLMEGPFRRSVILVLEHTDRGSYGLVINKTTDYSLEGAVRNFPQDVLDVFGHQPVQYGGPVRRLQYLHPVEGLTGSLKVPSVTSSDIFYGGAHLEATAAASEQRDSNGSRASVADQFQFFVGCCTWRPDQLADEVRHGCWFVAQAEDHSPLLQQTHEAATRNLADARERGASDDDASKQQLHDLTSSVLAEHRQGSSGRGSGGLDELAQHQAALCDGRDVDDKAGAWPLVMRRLSPDHHGLAWLPFWVDTSVVESCDWGQTH